jgi:predicted nucleotidyltransferase component of viral defense system
MTERPTKGTTAGQRYLDLQREARRSGRPTDELIQLYALEGFLDRLTKSAYAGNFVLKGGVLLAALDARRPTRDIDFAARKLDSDPESVLSVIQEIASVILDDGLSFDAKEATAETIREEDSYSGVRVSLDGVLSRAAFQLHVDINVGDPIWPEPQKIRLPRLLAGELIVRGYSLEMVLAEKVVTAIARGSANTRWRDFVDIHELVRRHDIDGTVLRESVRRVASHREVALTSLSAALADYAALAQPRWIAWLRKQRLDLQIPTDFSTVVGFVASFADPVLADVPLATWRFAERRWVSVSDEAL